MKIQLMLILATASLLTACATAPAKRPTPVSVAKTTAQPAKVTNDGLYSFPTTIEGGYWAMVGDVDGKYTVVDFNGNTSNHYQFECENGTKTYNQIGKETYTLKPSIDGMEVIHGSEPTFSKLKVIQIEPKKVLFLNQSFINPEMTKVLPKGLEFVYIYDEKLRPLCGS